MEETIKAYLAGVIDADGSICILSKDLVLRVSVAQANEQFLVFLREKVGLGGVYGGSYPHPDGYIRKPMFQWQMHQREAGKFLAIVLPYLSLKKQQACLAIEFMDTNNIKRKREIGQQIKILNNQPVMENDLRKERELEKLKRWQRGNIHPYL